MKTQRTCKGCAKPIGPLGKTGYCKACVRTHVIHPRATRAATLAKRQSRMLVRLANRDARRLKKLFQRPAEA